MFLVHGTIYAHGTIDSKIIFDGGGYSNFFSADGSNDNTFVDLNYCIIKNGNSFWRHGPGHFNLRYSELTDLVDYSYIWYPAKDVHIEHNKFINTGGFSVGHNYDVKVYIRYNLFKGKNANLPTYADFCIRNWASYSESETIVKYNSFIDMAGIVLELPPGYDSAAMTATENYWGTQDTDVIDQMIYDRNDDIRCPSLIEYLPILTEPHSETPIMLEDVNVGINGVFRRDGDGKWRCYANITIRNNSYRNVTISWIYLNAINITYTDETFEELNISGNETLNYVIQPEQELSANWTITTFGFTKEPKILWVLFKTPVSEAYGTISLTTLIPEFPYGLMPLALMILSALAVVLAKKEFKVEIRKSL